MEKCSAEETIEFDAAEMKIDDDLYAPPGIGDEIKGVEEPLTSVAQTIGAVLQTPSP